MPFPVINVIDLSGSPTPLPDLGVTVPASGSIALTPNNKQFEILNDDALLDALEAGNVALEVDGVTLSSTQSSSYLSPDLSSVPALGNFGASSDPGSGDDAVAGYSVGSRWVNTTTGAQFVCVDATASAAVWVGTGVFPSSSTDNAVVRFDGVSGSNLQGSAVSISDTGDVDTSGLYQIGSVRANDGVTAYDAIGGSTFGAGPATLVLDTTSVTSSLFSLASNELTVSVTGRYQVSYSVSLQGTTSSRSQIETWLERDTVEVGGSRGEVYIRNATSGASASAFLVLDVVAGEAFRLRAQRLAGSNVSAQTANGVRLTFVRMT